jgi:hypothetical protein
MGDVGKDIAKNKIGVYLSNRNRGYIQILWGKGARVEEEYEKVSEGETFFRLVCQFLCGQSKLLSFTDTRHQFILFEHTDRGGKRAREVMY